MSENNENQNGIFDEPEARYTAKRKHKDDFKRQVKLFFTIFLICAITISSYSFVLKPIIEYVEQTPEEIPVLLDGEVLGPQNRILITDIIEKENISSIAVHNEHGDWGFEYSEKDDDFYLSGNKDAPYDKDVFERLISSARNMLSMERITDNADNFAEYGLSELNNPAWFVLTEKDGKTHKLYIGDLLPSNAGYYVRYEGRDAVYVLDYENTLIFCSPVESVISPILALPTGNSYHTITNFALKRDGEIVVALEYIGEENSSTDSPLVTLHKFIYPEQYVPSDTAYLDVFGKFSYYTGISTLVYQPDIEDLKAYGLDKPKYDLYFEFMGYPNNIIFSEPNENGNYYAYSPVFDIISEVEADNAKWLDRSLLEWIERPILQISILDVQKLSVESKNAQYRFNLTSDETGIVSISEEVSGKDITDIDNFKKFYQTILMTSLQDYVNLTEDEVETLKQSDPYMTMTVQLKDGTSKEYKFYPYETRRAYYTTNGIGDFYVIRDRMIKIIDDAAKVLAGETVIPEANS